MGNISDFYLEHSNLHFSYFLNSRTLYNLEILLTIGFMVLKMTGLTPGFQGKNRFGKYPLSPDILAEMGPNLAFQEKYKKCMTFLPKCIFLQTDFCVETQVLSCFEYHEPYDQKNFFGLIMGS